MTTPKPLLCACALLAVLSPRASAQSDTAIRPFAIRVPDAVLTDLKARLVA